MTSALRPPSSVVCFLPLPAPFFRVPSTLRGACRAVANVTPGQCERSEAISTVKSQIVNIEVEVEDPAIGRNPASVALKVRPLDGTKSGAF